MAATWAPRGQTPILKRVGKFRREISTMVGLSISGKLCKRHFRGSIGAKKIVLGLEHLRRQIDGPFILIWDQARPHIAKCVEAYLCQHPEIHVEPLPAYAPELNPEEYCHGNIKQHLKNLLPDDVTQIRRYLNNGFARIRRRPDLILACFHHAGLILKQLW
jgi:transposase